MAQFIQPNQLSPVQGNIGNQAIVQDNSPTLDQLTTPLLQAVDMAGDIYGDARAKSITVDAIEEVDAAVAEAEKGTFTSGDKVPETLKVDQKQWDMLAAAVQSGNMSRENARLIAASRIRSRIAEEPMFANKMRKAASGVLGFNIESEAAQQYFNSFATKAQIAQQQANSVDKEKAKLMNEARRMKEVGIFNTVESGYSMLVRAEASKRKKELLENQLTVNGISSQEFASEYLQENQKTAWGMFLGEVKAFEVESGKAIDGVAFSRILDERKQLAVEEFNKAWRKGGTPLNTPEYDRALNNLTAQYTEMKEYAESYGIDNLTAVELERNVQARELYGDRFFPQMKLVVSQFGQQVASDIIKMAGMNDVQRSSMFKNNPQLKEAYELMGSDGAAFNKKMVEVTGKVIRGEPVDDESPAVVNAAAKEAHDNGSPESKKAVVEGLFTGGYMWKGLSLVANSKPIFQHPDNIKTFQSQYKEQVEPAMAIFTATVEADPTISWSVGEDGMITVTQDSAQGAMPSVAPGGLVENPREIQARLMSFRKAKQQADKLNQFAISHKNGWSRFVGENSQEYALRLEKAGREGQRAAQANQAIQVNEAANVVLSLIEQERFDEAEETYNQLREQSPLIYRDSWQRIIEQTLGE